MEEEDLTIENIKSPEYVLKNGKNHISAIIINYFFLEMKSLLKSIYKNVLVFKLKSFRNPQKDIVEAALKGYNLFVLMPTGIFYIVSFMKYFYY